MWKGKWNDIHIVGKKLAIKIVNKRISRDFSEEYSKLRFVITFKLYYVLMGSKFLLWWRQKYFCFEEIGKFHSVLTWSTVSMKIFSLLYFQNIFASQCVTCDWCCKRFKNIDSSFSVSAIWLTLQCITWRNRCVDYKMHIMHTLGWAGIICKMQNVEWTRLWFFFAV